MRSGFRRYAAPLGALLVLAAVLCACSSTSAKAPAPTPTSGAIQITLDRASYTSTDPIGVTITNSSKTKYYALDSHSACTFLQLEFYDTAHKTWAPTLPCKENRQPAALLIAPGMTEPFTLAPGNSSSNGNEWGPGLYRVGITYGTKADASGTVTTAYSKGFQITG